MARELNCAALYIEYKIYIKQVKSHTLKRTRWQYYNQFILYVPVNEEQTLWMNVILYRHHHVLKYSMIYITFIAF